MTRLFAGTEWDKPPRCEQCEELEADCQCLPLTKKYVAPEKQTARVRIEKRKRGKLMTVVSGLASANNDLAALLTKLKTQCGAGGTVKDEQVEIQGNHQERIERVLAEIGYRVK